MFLDKLQEAGLFKVAIFELGKESLQKGTLNLLP